MEDSHPRSALHEAMGSTDPSRSDFYDPQVNSWSQRTQQSVRFLRWVPAWGVRAMGSGRPSGRF